MFMKTAISTLRHSRTTFGEERRYAGSIDVPLSELGKRDCVEAAKALRGMRFDAVITSPLRRAVETGGLIDVDAPVYEECDLCRERSFGVLEGLTYDEGKALEPPVLYVRVGGDEHSVNPRGGEPFEVVWDRAQRFRKHLFETYEGSSMLVVSHYVFLQMLHGVLRGLNCIESLGSHVETLELTHFHFSRGTLIGEHASRLSSRGISF